MPVKFICPHCESLLRVTRRKIGVYVECPTCNEPSVVPEQQAAAETVARTMAARQSGLSRRTPVARANQPAGTTAGTTPGGALDAFESLDDLLPVAKSARHSGRPISNQPLTTARGGHSMTKDLVVIPRRAVYFQAACIPLLLAIGMTAGYLLGRSHTPPAPQDHRDAAKVQSIQSDERKKMEEWLFKDAA